MLKKFVVIFFAVCSVLSFSVYSQEKKNTGGWQKFVSKEGKFEILMPDEPQSDEGEDELPHYGKYKSLEYTSDGVNSDFIVTVAEFSKDFDPAPKSALVAEMANGEIANSTRTIQDVSVNVLGQPGRKVTLYVDKFVYVDHIKYVSQIMVFWVGKRFYMLQAKTNSMSEKSPEAEKFFNSFKIVD